MTTFCVTLGGPFFKLLHNYKGVLILQGCSYFAGVPSNRFFFGTICTQHPRALVSKPSWGTALFAPNKIECSGVAFNGSVFAYGLKSNTVSSPQTRFLVHKFNYC